MTPRAALPARLSLGYTLGSTRRARDRVLTAGSVGYLPLFAAPAVSVR